MLTSQLRFFGLLLFGLSWLSYDHYRPWVSFHSEAIAVAGIGLLALSLVSRRGTTIQTCGIVLAVLLAAAVPWLQWLTGVSYFAGDALVSSLYLVAFAFSIMIGFDEGLAAAGGPLRDIAPFLVVLWVAALASALIGLMQWLCVQDLLMLYANQTDPGDRAMGNLGQPNQLATLILMGSMVYLLAFEQKLFGRAGLVAGLGFMTLVLLLTESRAGFMSLLTVATFLCWKSWSKHIKLSIVGIAAWVAVFASARALVPVVHEALLIGSGRGMALTDVQSRWIIWKQIAYGIWQAPWVGYGWSQTPAAHAAGAIAFPGSQTLTHAHNVFLDLLAWNGIPLGLLIIGLCGWWLISRMRAVTEPRAVYCMAAILPIVMHSLVEYPFAYGYFLVAGGLLVGVVERSLKTKDEAITVQSHWLRGALGLWMVLGAGVVLEYLKVEEDFAVVRFENLRIGKTPTEYNPPDIRLLTHLGTMLRMSRIVPKPDMPPLDLQELDAVAQRFPYGTLALRNAVAKGLNGDPKGAAHQMAVIRGMYGENFYAAAKVVLQSNQERYPQLSAVILQ